MVQIMRGMTLTASTEDDQEELSNNNPDVWGEKVESEVRMTYIGLCGIPDKCTMFLSILTTKNTSNAATTVFTNCCCNYLHNLHYLHNTTNTNYRSQFTV